MSETISRRAALAGISVCLVPLVRARAQEPGKQAGEAFSLHAVPRRAKLLSREEAETWAFDGFSGPPVLRIRQGKELRVELRNGTPRPLSLHWHGVRGPAASDGVGGFSQPPVPSGARHEYRFTPPDPGTYLIRPLVVGGSSEPSGRGLAGLLVVEEPAAPAVDADYALLVRDWLLEPSGRLAPFGSPQEAATGGRLGNRLSVEGAEAPKWIEHPPGSRLRLRLANGCNARTMRIRFDGAKVYVVAVDGQPTETFEPLRSTLPFAPGTRYDVLLEMPDEANAKVALVALVGPGLPLLEIGATQAAKVERPPTAGLPLNSLLPPNIRLQDAVRKAVAITGGATRNEAGQFGYSGDPKSIWKLNGAAGSPGSPPLATVRRGQPLVLAISNRTPFVQPMHMHGHTFRLLHALDDGWEPYWLDTLQIAEGKTVHIATLADNPGRWLLSSSVLERFDTGLWGWFEVS